jgi:hypothetical protein
MAASKPPSPRSTKATTVRGEWESDIAICKEIDAPASKSCNAQRSLAPLHSAKSIPCRYFRADKFVHPGEVVEPCSRAACMQSFMEDLLI